MPDPWDQTFSGIRGVYRPEWIYPPLETPERLDAVERELGVVLPPSYRAFAERFGLDGELRCGLPYVMPLWHPPGADADDWGRSLVAATRFHRSYDWSKYNPDTPAAFFRGLIVFAIDGGYHTWAFDTAEIMNVSPREYAVIEIPRHGEPFRLATTFCEWLDHIDEAYNLPDDDPDAEPDPSLVPSLVYKPDSFVEDPMPYFRRPVRDKEKPDEPSVRRWLAANHGAALGLARAIRDGQTNAFGVLADALEDAGCTHADLLASCRDGDPAIDGVWVLRVLLEKASAR